MDFECIIFEKQAPLAIITLHRPRVLNAMNKQMWGRNSNRDGRRGFR
jgi:enoyl-CoA hydratase